MAKNLIWFVVDQMRAQAMSAHGDPNVRTPNLDAMRSYGVDFVHAVSGAPLCCPFRGSMLTGRYPHRCVPGHEYPLPPDMPTVAHAFADHGYRTGYFGKWHLDGFHERDGRAAFHTVPRERRGGYHTWIGYENNNSQFDCPVHGHDESGEIGRYRLPGYETDALVDLALGHLARWRADDPARPFFAVVSVQPPHDPYTAPAADMARHNPASLALRPNVPAVAAVERAARNDLAGYYAMIENIDANVGRLAGALERLDLADDTEVLFFSDHGDMHGSHGYFRKLLPFEESIRIPCLLFGRRTRYGHACGERPHLVNHVDLAPTSLGLCGIPVPEGMEGYDYSPLRRGEALADAPDSAYLQCVVSTGHECAPNYPWRGVVTDDGWKYACAETHEMACFDLNADPYEQVNLVYANHRRERRGTLNRLLREWVAKTGDAFAVPDVR